MLCYCAATKILHLQKLTLNVILCHFDSMVQKFGKQFNKNYSKVYGNLIYIKIFLFVQIFNLSMFFGDLTLSDSPDKHKDTGAVS